MKDGSEISGVLIKQECLIQAGRKSECWMLKKTLTLTRLRADISHRANHRKGDFMACFLSSFPP